VEGAGVASCAHETAVRARMRANKVCFIIFKSPGRFGSAGLAREMCRRPVALGLQGNGLRLSRRELRCEAPWSTGKEEKYPEQRLGCAALAGGSDSDRLCARTYRRRASVLAAWMLSPQERSQGLSAHSTDADHRMAPWGPRSEAQTEVWTPSSGGRGSRNDFAHLAGRQFGSRNCYPQTTRVHSSMST
jgi:hypothetical protein